MEDRKKSETELELGLDFAPEEREGIQRQKDYWQEFVHTGRVMDYLMYAQVAQQENTPMRLK